MALHVIAGRAQSTLAFVDGSDDSTCILRLPFTESSQQPVEITVAFRHELLAKLVDFLDDRIVHHLSSPFVTSSRNSGVAMTGVAISSSWLMIINL
ncbi:MAG TPA: hypothetical protein VGG06_18070 [Thermoanaerobaculia bacterium]